MDPVVATSQPERIALAPGPVTIGDQHSTCSSVAIAGNELPADLDAKAGSSAGLKKRGVELAAPIKC